MLPLRFGRTWLLIGWLGVFTAAAASVAPGLAEIQLGFSDKIGHALVYFLLMLWFAGIYRRQRYLLIAAGLFGLGVALELVQAHVGRDASALDMAANLTGIGIGFGLAWHALGGWCAKLECWLLTE
ncbi:MAG TPA: VanZ family protein [Gammaproteobacteria bacterium]|nr:VanZ family protein [Gammaproteobacteria bacterium]